MPARLRLLCLLFLSSGSWLLGPPVGHAQAPQPTDPAATAPDLPRLLAAIAPLPDTSRMNQLRDFTTRLCREGRLTEAAQAVSQVRQLAHRLGTPDQLAYAWQSAGQLASRMGPDSAAIGAFHRGLGAAHQPRPASLPAGHYYAAQVRLLLNLSSQYLHSRNLGFAASYAQQALTLAQQQALPLETAMAYSGLAGVANQQQRPAAYFAYSAAALRGYQRAGRWDKYYAALRGRASALAEHAQYAAADSLFRQILAYAQRTHTPQLVGEVYSAWPATLWHLHQPARAERVARAGLAWANRVHDIFLNRLDTYTFLTQLKAAQGDYRQALAYQQRQQQLQDSLLNQQKNAQLVEAEARYQSAQKQARITLLAQRNRLLRQHQARQQRELLALAAGLAVVGLLLGLVLRQRRQLRQVNAQLRATNQTVGEQARRLTTLLQELHHRVKNNLATVASLLRLQGNRLTDTTAQRAMQESRQRVEAMSLIHQRLYQGQEVTQVDMHAYLLDLTESLLRAYGHAPHAVEVMLEVPTPALDVDVAVPLGLLVNELVTNSLKHAFTHVAQPQLRLHLHQSSTHGLTLEVADNGPGFDPAQVSPTSFGQRLIAVLSEQLGGQWQQRPQAGACYHLHIPAAALPARP